MSDEINVAFKIPVSVNDEAGRRASVRGVSKATILAEAVADGLEAPREATEHSPTAITVDDALAVLRQHLPSRVGEFMDEMTLQEGRQPLEMFQSWIITIFDQHQQSVRSLEAQPDDLTPRQTGTPQLGQTKPCAYCGQSFQVARLGQAYCPDTPDSAEPSCGRKAYLDGLRQRRAAKHLPPVPFERKSTMGSVSV